MRKSRFRVACVALCAFAITAIAGCDRGPVTEKSIVISGTVRSATTHVPIASAWVAISDSISGFRAETDSSGQFARAIGAGGQRRLFAGATGHLTSDTTLEDTRNDIEGLVIELAPSQ